MRCWPLGRARRASASPRCGRPVSRRVPVPRSHRIGARAPEAVGTGRPDWLGGPRRQRRNLPLRFRGNGIELYADRPPEAWPPRGPDGQVTMYTEALDSRQCWRWRISAGPILPAATRIGHVHLSVADLGHAEQLLRRGPRVHGDATELPRGALPRTRWVPSPRRRQYLAQPPGGCARHAGPGRVHRACGASRGVCRGSPSGWRDAGRLREASGDVATAHDLDEMVVRLVQPRWAGLNTSKVPNEV